MDKNNDGQISKVKSLTKKMTVLFDALTSVSGRAEAGQEEPDDEANRVDHQEAGYRRRRHHIAGGSQEEAVDAVLAVGSQI